MNIGAHQSSYVSFFLFTSFAFFCHAEDVELWETKDLRAVTHFKGIDEFYRSKWKELSELSEFTYNINVLSMNIIIVF